MYMYSHNKMNLKFYYYSNYFLSKIIERWSKLFVTHTHVQKLKVCPLGQGASCKIGKGAGSRQMTILEQGAPSNKQLNIITIMLNITHCALYARARASCTSLCIQACAHELMRDVRACASNLRHNARASTSCLVHDARACTHKLVHASLRARARA